MAYANFNRFEVKPLVFYYLFCLQAKGITHIHHHHGIDSCSLQQRIKKKRTLIRC